MNSIDLYFGLNLMGLVFGFGAVLVILFLGVRSLYSNYWFRALNSTDKTTIPMIWFGSACLTAALAIDYFSNIDLHVSFSLKLFFLILMLANGCYLTFVFAPVIRKEENNPEMTFLKLPMPHQLLIFISGGISALSWTSHAIIFWLEIIKN